MYLIQNGKDFILTIAERKTRFLLMEQLTDGKNANDVAMAVIKLLKPFKKNTLSITTDNGGKFAKHKRVSKPSMLQSFSRTPTHPGKREQSKTPTNPSDNTLTNK